MDPISIAGACFAISKIVYTNIKRCREIDETLDALAADQKELAKTIRLFQSELSQETFNTGKEQWQTLQSSLNGLSTTMKSLENILTEIRVVELGVASRPVQVIRLQMKNEDIDAIKRRIEAYTRAIQLSVQFITL
jgi:archaellum component FlaC